METRDEISKITVGLVNGKEWDKCKTINANLATAKGRRLLPDFELCVHGLDPKQKYAMAMHLELVDRSEYRRENSVFVPNGKNFKVEQQSRYVLHHDGLKTGEEWMMASSFKFDQVRITVGECNTDQKISVCLKHRYKPVLSILKWLENGTSELIGFAYFDNTDFIAVSSMPRRELEYPVIQNKKLKHSIEAILELNNNEKNPENDSGKIDETNLPDLRDVLQHSSDSPFKPFGK